MMYWASWKTPNNPMT